MDENIANQVKIDQKSLQQGQNQMSLKVNADIFKRTLSQINKSLQQNKTSSSLLNHRAIIHYQAGQKEQSLRDFHLALDSNHLNFMAYFNLFSVYLQEKRLQQAFDQLCCSLSCLYLIRAKCKRRQLDAQKSIIYANNNIQAHVLKCLMFMQKKDKTNLKLALDQMNITLQILSQNNQLDQCKKLNKLKALIIQDMQKKQLYQTIIHIKHNESLKNSTKSDQIKNSVTQNQKCHHKLKNSYKKELSLKQEIYQRLLELNLVFQQLIDNQFKIVSKSSRKQSPKNNIFQLSKKIQPFLSDTRKSQEMINEKQINGQLKSQTIYIKKKEVNPQNFQEEKNGQLKTTFNIEVQRKQIAQHKVKQVEFATDQVELGQSSYPLYEENSSNSQKGQIQQNLNSFNQIINYQEEENSEKVRKVSSQQCIEVSDIYIKDVNTLKNSENNKRILPNTKSYLNVSIKSQVQSSLGQSNQVINFYKDLQKVGRRKRLQFKIISFLKTQNFSSKKKSKKYLYCLGEYNYENKEKNQFKTSCQKLQEGRCLWDQIYPPVKLSKNPQFFKIHVYSKNYFSEFDQFVGSGQKQLTMTGQNQIQIVNPNLQIVGIILLKVYLV